MQTDGRIVIGGEFTTLNGVTRNRIARLNGDGSMDTTYNPNASGYVTCMTPQPDGKLLIGGNFTTIASTSRTRLARLNVDGTLDTTFNLNLNDIVRTIILLPDGKILISGNFTVAGGAIHNRLARLNADGTVDPTFTTNINGPVYSMSLMPDGMILVGGTFTGVDGVFRQNLARLNPDGTLDTGFGPGVDNIVRSLAVQADGKVILGGEFDVVDETPRSRYARLNPNGSLDQAFVQPADADVFGVTLQANGRVLLAGKFSAIGATARPFLARLENDPATQSLTATSSSRLQWLRGGSSPEASFVTFEISADGGLQWSVPARATRIPGGWELTGLNLPPSGLIRARARVATGYSNGSSSLLETRAPLAFSPLQSWRYQYFGVTESTGSAADNADPDHDGLENLVEYAFGMNPLLPDAASLPTWRRADDDLELSFTRSPSAEGVTLHAEYSSTLDPGDWTELANLATVPSYRWLAPADNGGRLYLRLRVTAP